MIKDELYKQYLTDWTHNFNTFKVEELKEFKNNITQDDINNMSSLLDEMFTYGLQSVTYDRPEFVKHLNKHQYFSMANFWWPNPDTEDGLPYIRKDGYVNPDSVKWCKHAVRKVGFTLYNASLMYYFTEDKKYYELLKNQINNFFVNEETKMLPNIEYAQMVLGHPTDSNGRKTGVMDLTSHIGYGLCIFKALYLEGLVEEELYTNLQKWIKELITWLETAKVAIEERDEPNNHGTLFSLFLAQVYYFVDDIDSHKDEIVNRLNNLLKDQVEEDGSMPLELDRTRSIAYTTMNLKGFIDAYKLLDVDYVNNDLIKKAFEFMLPVLNGDKDISDIKILDSETNELRGCIQIEGTYLECYKCYLKHEGKKMGYDVKVVNPENLPYIYFLK